MIKKKKIKVLSLFDGISCAQIALKKLGYIPEYYASEIDKYAIQITQNNHPKTIQVGDVKLLNEVSLYKIRNCDLLIGGSPCQDLSIAKKNREGLAGKRSGLFYEYLRILKEIKPKYFILENVNSMPQEAKEEITKQLGVEPIMINASLVSAQNRKRLFWTNIPGIILPEDKGILLKDIIQSGKTKDLKSYPIDANYFKGFNSGKNGGKPSYKKYKRQCIIIGNTHPSGNGMNGSIYSINSKSPTITTNKGEGNKILMIQVSRGNNKGGVRAINGKTPSMSCSQWEYNNQLLFKNGMVRKLTPIECERLQCLPDNYTGGVSNTQRYKACGNAFNVDVVKHILSFAKF